MEIKDAWWDTRNLGVTCAEIEMNATDPIELAHESIETTASFSYVTAKIPPGRLDLIHEFEGCGFAFMETLIEMRHDLKDINLPPIVERFTRNVTHADAQNDVEDVLEKIHEGVFATDRIFLDEGFTNEKAATRYMNWIRDELDNGAELIHIQYKGKNIGFFSFKESEGGVGLPFLSGIYDKTIVGAGSSVVTEPLKHARNKKCRYVCTHVSSNNVPIIRIHEQAGFYTTDLRYVMTRHQK